MTHTEQADLIMQECDDNDKSFPYTLQRLQDDLNIDFDKAMKLYEDYRKRI